MPRPVTVRPGSTPVAAPYWTTNDRRSVRLYHGNVSDVLARLPAKSVQTVVTSPPYWGLRDYGTGFWEGGDPECDHKRPSQSPGHHADRNGKIGVNNTNWDHRHEIGYKGVCKKCGAIQLDSQLGSEPSPDCGSWGEAGCGKCYVCAMVRVFREVRRVLRDDGTLWLNLGDSYNANQGKGFNAHRWEGGMSRNHEVATALPPKGKTGLASGNMLGVPWRVALSLQRDGWVLRQDVIWHKPSPMPESVRNRCTKAHEYVFLLTKSMAYYYDAEAIKEPSGGAGQGAPPSNKRSVWTVASQPYPGAHFATFPPKLIEPMIKAGTSEAGACPECGTPWDRVTVEKKLTRERPNDFVKRSRNGGKRVGNSTPNSAAGVETTTTGWRPGCSCRGRTYLGDGNVDEYDLDPVPCVVLDPFVGSGTTAEVSLKLGRRCWGVDLSETYLRANAVERVIGTLLADYNIENRVGGFTRPPGSAV